MPKPRKPTRAANRPGAFVASPNGKDAVATISVRGEQLDGWWSRLSLEAKANIFQTNIDFNIDDEARP